MRWITRQRLVVAALVASVAVNIGFVAYLANSGGLKRILLRFDLVQAPSERAGFQVEDEARFRLLPNTPAELVFAGDSLAADGPWAELYSDVHNRGIGGERSFGLLGRLDEILASHPKMVVFLVGSNDLSNVIPPAQILRNYRAILTRVRDESPATRVLVLALWPVNPHFKDSPIYTNEHVKAVNEPLRELVREFPAVRYVDLTDQLADDKGELKAEYTIDGLHLNVRGYLAIDRKLRAALDAP